MGAMVKWRSHGAAGRAALGPAAAEAHHLHCDSETVVPGLILEIRNTAEFEEKSEVALFLTLSEIKTYPDSIQRQLRSAFSLLGICH